ncbi:MAG TPA: phage gp6-like head-tail connector protein [Kribbella sp.]
MTWRPDYITAAELAAYLNVTDSLDDAELVVWVTAASRAVDKRCNRQFGKLSTAAARTYRRPAVYDVVTGLWLVEIDDVQDVTGLTVGGVAYASSGATLLPDNAPADGVPYERLGFTDAPTVPVVVSAVWGWTAVPSQVVGAVKLQGARWNARRNSPLGIAGSPDQGSEMRLLARLDPDVSTTLTGLARRRRVG